MITSRASWCGYAPGPRTQKHQQGDRQNASFAPSMSVWILDGACWWASCQVSACSRAIALSTGLDRCGKFVPRHPWLQACYGGVSCYAPLAAGPPFRQKKKRLHAVKHCSIAIMQMLISMRICSYSSADTRHGCLCIFRISGRRPSPQWRTSGGTPRHTA